MNTEAALTDVPIETLAMESPQVEIATPVYPAEGSRPQSDDEWEDETRPNLVLAEPAPPNGGYGWVCTFAVFLINAHTWGISVVSDTTTTCALLH